MSLNKIVCIAVLSLTIGQAGAAEPAPGEYISEHGWGDLSVMRKADGKLHFAVASMGANGHSCSVDGTIQNNRAVLDDAAPGNACHITFKSDAGGIDVVLGQADECRYYCGMRASFDGRYHVPATGCHNRERKSAQEKFAKFYGAKDYQAALSALQPVLHDCAATLFWLEEAQIRNDLAVTLCHLGRKEECRAILKPTIDAHGTTEDALREELPPTDFESWLPLAKAAWFNQGLCSGK